MDGSYQYFRNTVLTEVVVDVGLHLFDIPLMVHLTQRQTHHRTR
jgi:hypothetical protein